MQNPRAYDRSSLISHFMAQYVQCSHYVLIGSRLYFIAGKVCSENSLTAAGGAAVAAATAADGMISYKNWNMHTIHGEYGLPL